METATIIGFAVFAVLTAFVFGYSKGVNARSERGYCAQCARNHARHRKDD